MRVIGVDPGSVICGYGVVERTGKRYQLIEYGVIKAKAAGEALPLRCRMIYTRLQQVIERSLPDEMALESLFYAKNVASVIKLSHARGAAMLSGAMREIPVIEYSPKEVKRAVTGRGGADKKQVQFMVRDMLGIEETHEFYDATDALAVAICHLNKVHSPLGRPRSWKQFIEEHPDRIVGSKPRKNS